MTFMCMQALHLRLQPFLLFFIDGASFIDAEDMRWELLLATEQHEGQETVVRAPANPCLLHCITAMVSSVMYS